MTFKFAGFQKYGRKHAVEDRKTALSVAFHASREFFPLPRNIGYYFTA
jgi:hypothetical protein